MAVSQFFSVGASFFYAVAALLDGANNNAGVQQTLVRNFQSAPMHYVPVSLFTTPNDASQQQVFGRSNNVNIAPPMPPIVIQSMPRYPTRGRDIPLPPLPFFNAVQVAPPAPERDPIAEIEAEAASKVLTNIVNPRFSNYSRMNYIPMELNYYDGQTIATVFTDASGNVSRCKLLEVNKPEEAKEALKRLAEEKKILEKASFKTVLTIITACQALDPMAMTQMNPGDAPPSPLAALIEEKRYNMWSVLSGILPGTKWCGLGDIAKEYDDLGRERNLDKCCRAHDLCPTKIKAFRSRYGLVNWSLYTKSHCDCDSLLYDCLKKATHPTADLLGNFYFNVLRVQCVDDDQSNNTNVPFDDPEAQRLVFREVRREF